MLVLAGLLVALGALAARGGDLRAGRNQDLQQLTRARAAENKDLAAQVATLRSQLDQLSAQHGDQARTRRLQQLSAQSGDTPVTGPGVTVTLDDAPLSVNPQDVDPDLLVVHQQDIQMVVNLLWQAGAEAMTIQGQRVIATTAVKCVGNTVVLHGVPYAPPYQISAIGSTRNLLAALDASDQVRIYRQYVSAYQLGWQQQGQDSISMPAHNGRTGLQYAHPPR